MRTSSLIARREFTPKISRVIRILFVEDCKSDVFIVERLLEEVSVNCFYEITNVPRLIDAFYKIDREKFNLIMLDLNLLDIAGVASIAALRSHAPLIPIIIYSGMEDANIKEKALMCGATHYLVKGKESGYSLKYLIENTVI